MWERVWWGLEEILVGTGTRIYRGEQVSEVMSVEVLVFGKVVLMCLWCLILSGGV